MCDRNGSMTDSTADLVLTDLLTATEDLLEFTINVLDTIRLQTHFNDRNRRINLGMQLKDASDAYKCQFGFVTMQTKPCAVATTLKYDLGLYLSRILLACKRTKANLMLLRVTRVRAANTTLLLVASTGVRVEQLNKKVQLLICLVKENGGEFPKTKKKKKKKKKKEDQLETTVSNASITKNEANDEEKKPTGDESPKVKPPESKKKPVATFMPKEDLNDYVEIALSFRQIISKYREFIQHVRSVARSNIVTSGQATVGNSIFLVPIAANAINELNSILNRLLRIAYSIEIESNYSRRPPADLPPIETGELYRQRTNENSNDELSTASNNQMLNVERIGSSRAMSPRPDGSAQQGGGGSSLKPGSVPLIKQNGIRSGENNNIEPTLSSFRNQSAMPGSSSSNVNTFKLTPNMIANIFEDFFMNTNDLTD